LGKTDAETCSARKIPFKTQLQASGTQDIAKNALHKDYQSGAKKDDALRENE